MTSSNDEPQSVAKFIQICASQNDLFALDVQGNIYQYNFNAMTWEKLAASRSGEGSKRGNHEVTSRNFGGQNLVAERIDPDRRRTA